MVDPLVHAQTAASKSVSEVPASFCPVVAIKKEPGIEEYFTAGRVLQECHDQSRQQQQDQAKTTSLERAHVCRTCGASYASRFGLHRHLQSSHSGVKYACSICGQQRKRKDYLKTHFQKDHQIFSSFNDFTKIVTATAATHLPRPEESQTSADSAAFPQVAEQALQKRRDEVSQREQRVKIRESEVSAREAAQKQAAQAIKDERAALEREWAEFEAAKTRHGQAAASDTSALQRQLIGMNSRETGKQLQLSFTPKPRRPLVNRRTQTDLVTPVKMETNTTQTDIPEWADSSAQTDVPECTDSSAQTDIPECTDSSTQNTSLEATEEVLKRDLALSSDDEDMPRSKTRRRIIFREDSDSDDDDQPLFGQLRTPEKAASASSPATVLTPVRAPPASSPPALPVKGSSTSSLLESMEEDGVGLLDYSYDPDSDLEL